MPDGRVSAAAGLNGTALDANRAVATGAKPFPAPARVPGITFSTTRQGRLFPTLFSPPPPALSEIQPICPFLPQPGHCFSPQSRPLSTDYWS
jgi:hypothetical protein